MPTYVYCAECGRFLPVRCFIGKKKRARATKVCLLCRAMLNLNRARRQVDHALEIVQQGDREGEAAIRRHRAREQLARETASRMAP